MSRYCAPKNSSWTRRLRRGPTLFGPLLHRPLRDRPRRRRGGPGDARSPLVAVRGDGDAQAAEIYATAYNKDPEFYAFYRSIDAYRKSMGREGDLLVLDPNNDFFRYLNEADGGR